jgi:hypothetical protein
VYSKKYARPQAEALYSVFNDFDEKGKGLQKLWLKSRLAEVMSYRISAASRTAADVHVVFSLV